MKAFWRHYLLKMFNRLKWLIFPHRCIWCDEIVKYGETECENCRNKVKFIKNETCSVCGRDIENCSCGNLKYCFLRNISCFYYENAGAKGIINFKLRFPDNRKLNEFSKILISKIKKSYVGVEFDLITCVPLYRKKLRKRGFNQSALLAEKISKELSIDFCEDLIIKIKDTIGQHELNQNERMKNLKNSFTVNNKYNIKGFRILLVDDVITTGSTLNECSKVLLKSGADSVYCSTLAATNHNKEE